MEGFNDRRSKSVRIFGYNDFFKRNIRVVEIISGSRYVAHGVGGKADRL